MSNNLKDNIEKTGLSIPNILLPSPDTDFTKWSVVACDQYSSQADYWERVDAFVKDSPSTIKLILPEVYLEDENWENKIEYINHSMKEYLSNGVFDKDFNGFILIDRKTSHAKSRKGLMVALDLEHYDYKKGSETLIRATEGTVVDRLPPRKKIRKNAPLELPHIMVLIDDPYKTVIEPLFEKVNSLKKLYDFELMENGGHIKGYAVDAKPDIERIYSAIVKLMDRENFISKYNLPGDTGILLYAVGDGNHSLASAKEHWEDLKSSLSPDTLQFHPARFALVELVNVHDEGITFEPIHRVAFNCNINDMKSFAMEYNKTLHNNEITNMDNSPKNNLKIITKTNSSEQQIAATSETSQHIIPYETENEQGVFVFESPSSNLPVGSLQDFLDALIKSNPQVKLDYIHGEDTTKKLGTKTGNIGFYLPNMSKYQLFKTVILDGALPRKTFSMGEAEEKRFYLECRKIQQ